MIKILLLGLWLLAGSPGAAAIILIEESFDDYAGLGLSPGGGRGTLDSWQWQISGASSGNSSPGEHTLLGDFARGLTAGGVRTGGLYAVSLPNGKRALGVQATTADFTPGAVLWSITNPTDRWLSHLLLSFDFWWLNDGGRGTAMDVHYSSDGLSWDLLARERTPSSSDDLGWQFRTRTVPIGWLAVNAAGPLETDLAQTYSLAPGAPFWLRWRFTDNAGRGTRDELALTSLRVRAQDSLVLLNDTPTLWSTVLAMLLLGARSYRCLVPGSNQSMKQTSPSCNAMAICA